MPTTTTVAVPKSTVAMPATTVAMPKSTIPIPTSAVAGFPGAFSIAGGTTFPTPPPGPTQSSSAFGSSGQFLLGGSQQTPPLAWTLAGSKGTMFGQRPPVFGAPSALLTQPPRGMPTPMPTQPPGAAVRPPTGGTGIFPFSSTSVHHPLPVTTTKPLGKGSLQSLTITSLYYII